MRTITDWKCCIKLCWHICRMASQEAYNSVNRPLYHSLSMCFGHMRHAAHVLCKADNKSEEQGLHVMERKCVATLKISNCWQQPNP